MCVALTGFKQGHTSRIRSSKRRALVSVVVAAVLVQACSGHSPAVSEPEFDDLVWTVHESWLAGSEPEIHVSALATTGERTVVGGVDSSDRLFVVESSDSGESWTELANEAEWIGPLVGGVSYSGIALFNGRVGLRAVVAIATDRDLGWAIRYPDGSRLEESLAVSASVDGDTYLVVGMRGPEGDDYPVVWRSEDAGESWQAVALPSESGVRGRVTSIASRDRSIVVGGFVERRGEAELFSDGTYRKPVVWVSPDDGASWDEIRLDSLDAPEARVTIVAVADGGFRAIGSVTDLARNPSDTPDLTQWSTSGDLHQWYGSQLAESGAQTASVLVENTTNLYVVGTSRAETGGLRRLVIWKSEPDGLVRLKEFEPFDGHIGTIAGAARVGDHWLLVGTRTIGGDFTHLGANWLVVGET